MADRQNEKSAADTAEEQAKAAGRSLQATERADTPKEQEKAARTEEPPKANPSAPDKPAADANPSEAVGEGDSWPNYMSKRGLNEIQKARVEGTPIDGALGATTLGVAATRTPTRDERRAAAAQESAKRSRKDE